MRSGGYMMEIKRLTIKDISILRKVGELFWGEARCDQQLSKFLSNERNYAYVVLDNDVVAGFAFGYILDTFYSEPMFYMHSIDVSERYKRKRLGKSIMKKIIEDCKAQGIRECFLITNKSNSAAVNLYQSLGGKLLNDDDIVYGWDFDS